MNTTQKGFSHPLGLVLVLLVVAVVGFAGWMSMRGDGGNGDGQNTSGQSGNNDGLETTEQKPELKNLGLSAIAPYNAATGMSGEVPVTADALREYDDKGLKGFYIFGDKLGKDDARKNPNFEFASLKANTPVVASISGVVVHINRQADSNDYEVFLQPTEGSAWTIGYDHLIDVAVLKGETVKVGDKLGTAAVQGNGLARFEIQVNYDKDGKTLHYCPSALLDDVARTRDALLQEVAALQAAWETLSGRDLYDQTAQKIPGCLSETMTPEEAEGR